MAAILMFVVGTIAPVHPKDASRAKQNDASQTGLHDFDFLVGQWRVHHRRFKADTHEWVDFDGTCTNRPLMGGGANIEEHTLNPSAGTYRAIALRAYDSKTRQWAIWWLDGRYPSGPLDPPVKGGFENGIGAFYATYTQDGKSMRLRFLWSNITPTSARWEQSVSSDGGKTWTANWIMNFQRDTWKNLPTSADGGDVHDFDFLSGDWCVHHRYLRVKENRREWLEVDGTMSHRELMGGRANVEEYTINAGQGAYRAVALRSYNPKTVQWSIWWLDGRTPHINLDPPVKGRFESGLGSFFGDAPINGKPMLVRFIWSHITLSSARWAQDSSSDAGKTWETNWIMEFQRCKASGF